MASWISFGRHPWLLLPVRIEHVVTRRQWWQWWRPQREVRRYRVRTISLVAADAAM